MDGAGRGRDAIEMVQAHGRAAAETVMGVEDHIAECYRPKTEGRNKSLVLN